MRLTCLYRAERRVGLGVGGALTVGSTLLWRPHLDPSSWGPSCSPAPGSSSPASPPPPNPATASQLALEASSPNRVGYFLRNGFPFNLFSRGSKRNRREAAKLPSLAEPVLGRGAALKDKCLWGQLQCSPHHRAPVLFRETK